jgi:hypothetical protein
MQLSPTIFTNQRFSNHEENRTFKRWYEVFCASLKIDKKTYKPSQIEEFEKKCNLILIDLGNILK